MFSKQTEKSARELRSILILPNCPKSLLKLTKELKMKRIKKSSFKFKCSSEGCPAVFATEELREEHETFNYHCANCGMATGKQVGIKTYGTVCSSCEPDGYDADDLRGDKLND
jgi:hypothetical protein